jgi:hypothetical protein
MAQEGSPRHPPVEGRDHTEEPARIPGNGKAGKHDAAAEPGKTPGTGEGGRETTRQPRHPARTKRPRRR